MTQKATFSIDTPLWVPLLSTQQPQEPAVGRRVCATPVTSMPTRRAQSRAVTRSGSAAGKRGAACPGQAVSSARSPGRPTIQGRARVYAGVTGVTGGEGSPIPGGPDILSE